MDKFLKIIFSFFLLSVLLLNGCATKHAQKDGPPPFSVDESQIPDAVPKHEKLAKYGNMDQYRVYGKYYHVMRSAKNYEETGTASWYGMKFHKQKTSSGEPYNLLGMTAAHRTLPLPTYVQVTNLNNDRKVIVKVNDRGPFASNRIIDLSYVAAKKLGMIGHGTTHVHVKAIDPEDIGSDAIIVAKNTTTMTKTKVSSIQLASIKKVSSKPGSYLQVGAFRSKGNAEQLKRKLEPMLSSRVEITKLTNLYKVKIGPIKDVNMADNITKKLRSIGLTAKPMRV